MSAFASYESFNNDYLHGVGLNKCEVLTKDDITSSSNECSEDSFVGDCKSQDRFYRKPSENIHQYVDRVFDEEFDVTDSEEVKTPRLSSPTLNELKKKLALMFPNSRMTQSSFSYEFSRLESPLSKKMLSEIACKPCPYNIERLYDECIPVKSKIQNVTTGINYKNKNNLNNLDRKNSLAATNNSLKLLENILPCRPNRKSYSSSGGIIANLTDYCFQTDPIANSDAMLLLPLTIPYSEADQIDLESEIDMLDLDNLDFCNTNSTKNINKSETALATVHKNNHHHPGAKYTNLEKKSKTNQTIELIVDTTSCPTNDKQHSLLPPAPPAPAPALTVSVQSNCIAVKSENIQFDQLDDVRQLKSDESVSVAHSEDQQPQSISCLPLSPSSNAMSLSQSCDSFDQVNSCQRTQSMCDYEQICAYYTESNNLDENDSEFTLVQSRKVRRNLQHQHQRQTNKVCSNVNSKHTSSGRINNDYHYHKQQGCYRSNGGMLNAPTSTPSSSSVTTLHQYQNRQRQQPAKSSQSSTVKCRIKSTNDLEYRSRPFAQSETNANRCQNSQSLAKSSSKHLTNGNQRPLQSQQPTAVSTSISTIGKDAAQHEELKQFFLSTWNAFCVQHKQSTKS